jgi:beta-lactamase class C
MKYCLLWFCLGQMALPLLLNGCVENVASSTVVPPLQPSVKRDPKLEAFVSEYLRFFSTEMEHTSQAPGAAMVIVKGDSIVYIKGFGVKVAGTRDSIDSHTVFRIGSLSKGFAGILTGILVQQGLLHWEDPVRECYPAFTLKDRKQARRMKLWHLLSHTTGLPYHAFTNLIEEGYDVPKIVKEYFPKAPVSGEEGVFFSYQNAAFCVIEEVMRARTEKDYAQLLRENILAPAAMVNTSCSFATMTNSNNITLPHFWTGYNWHSEPISPLYYNAVAAGGVNASISDMGEWLKLLLGHKPAIIADSTLEKVFTPVVKTGKERRIFPQWLDRDAASYALGWRVLEHGGDTIVYHGGYVNGYRGEIAFNRKEDIGICVLFNASCDLGSKCIPEFFDRWRETNK